ncbi:MAG: hypothetical protein ABFC56_16050 [Clostridiaceae bacterium]
MQSKSLSISSKAEISAIYFALLQCGYDFYALEKDAALVTILESFREEENTNQHSFFSEIRQKTCQVYPYWPRAAILEEATFYLDDSCADFVNFDQLHRSIMNAANISSLEKSNDLWVWISRFPAALQTILDSSSFQLYLTWERGWIAEQNEIFREELIRLQTIFDQCNTRYDSPLQGTHVLLNPIKCTYSSDYYTLNNQFYFSSGQFRLESVVHEFLHPILHTNVIQHSGLILQKRGAFLDLDASYLLDGSDQGALNAAEEYFVRNLTECAVRGTLPGDFDRYIQDSLGKL